MIKKIAFFAMAFLALMSGAIKLAASGAQPIPQPRLAPRAVRATVGGFPHVSYRERGAIFLSHAAIHKFSRYTLEKLVKNYVQFKKNILIPFIEKIDGNLAKLTVAQFVQKRPDLKEDLERLYDWYKLSGINPPKNHNPELLYGFVNERQNQLFVSELIDRFEKKQEEIDGRVIKYQALLVWGNGAVGISLLIWALFGVLN